MQHVLGEQEMESVTVVPYLFEGHLVLSLDQGWLSAFGGRLTFRSFLDRRRRLCLVSEQYLK